MKSLADATRIGHYALVAGQGSDDVARDSVRLDLYVHREEDRPSFRLPDGREVRAGESLRSLVDRLGGWTGTLPDPWGGEHPVSIEEYRDEDLDRTFVQISFRSKPVQPRFAAAEVREQMAGLPTTHLNLYAADEDDPDWGLDADGMPRGVTLREMRARLGGEAGFLPDRNGRQHHVSLRAWRESDPDQTRIIVQEMHGQAEA
jgi:hypothetical protein